METPSHPGSPPDTHLAVLAQLLRSNLPPALSDAGYPHGTGIHLANREQLQKLA